MNKSQNIKLFKISSPQESGYWIQSIHLLYLEKTNLQKRKVDLSPVVGWAWGMTTNVHKGIDLSEDIVLELNWDHYTTLQTCWKTIGTDT